MATAALLQRCSGTDGSERPDGSDRTDGSNRADGSDGTDGSDRAHGTDCTEGAEGADLTDGIGGTARRGASLSASVAGPQSRRCQ
jgi:hypothetical protein